MATMAAVAAVAGASAPSSQTIEDCVRRALDRAPTLQGAAADSAAAAARVRAARAAYWPRASAQAQYGRSQGYDAAVTNGGVSALGLAIDAPLFDGGARAAALAAARAHLRSATTLEQQRRSNVATAVRHAYYAALAARSEMQIQQTSIDAVESYLALLQRQEQLGLVPATDVPRVELAAESARSALRAAAATADATMYEIAILTGTPIESDALVEPLPAQLTWADDVIETSPIVVDARAAAEAAWRDADVVRADGRARVGLTADAGFLGVDPGRTFRENGGGQFLVGFTVPLFDGGAVAARTAAALAAATSAEATVAQIRESLTVALARTRSEADRARVDAEAWRRVLPAAREGFLLMRARHVGGADVRLLDVIDALNQSVDAQLALTRATLAFRLAVATHAQLLGRTEI